MANTIQKRIKFSKGQIVPELVERTDMDFYDSSAQEMKNVVSSVYGGVKSRGGTRFIDYITRMEETGPVSTTSDIFQDTSHFTDLTAVNTQNIGNGTVIAKFDYGANVSSEDLPSFFLIKGMHYKGLWKIYDEPGTYTFNITKGGYWIDMLGAAGGGNSLTSLQTTDPTSGYVFGASGGSGASFTGSVSIASSGQCTVTVGAAGSGYNDGGTTSFVTPDNYSITAGGGGGSIAVGTKEGYTQSAVGSAGTLTYVPADPWAAGFVVSRLINPQDGHGDNGEIGWTTNTSITLSDRDTQLRKRGLDGIQVDPNTHEEVVNTGDYGYSPGRNVTSAYGSQDISVSGRGGLFSIQDRNDLGIQIWGSFDDVNYEYLNSASFAWYGEEKDIDLTFPKTYRYIKVVKPNDGDYNYNELGFQYMRYTSTLTDVDAVKLESFVYNNDNKYLLVICHQKIQIFEDDELVAVVTTDIPKAYLKNIKMASKDDTIIFTHPQMPPKILKRVRSDNWVFGDLDIQNIPYGLFGDEQTMPRDHGLTLSDTEGIITATAGEGLIEFSETYVGQYIDGNGGRLKITEYISPNVVRGVTVIPFYTTYVSSWNYIYGYEPVWSSTRGYPRTCLFAQQRLWFGGSRDKPSTIWASRVGDYYNFENTRNNDNEAIDVDLLTNDVIVNLSFNRGLHVFTTGQELSSPEDSYTPDKISFVVNTQNGSLPHIKPVSLNGTLCFIEKNGKSMLTYVYDDSQAAYTTDNLSILSNLISEPRQMDVEVNSSKDKGDFIYIVLEDGTMLCCCVSLGQKIMSISKYETDGKIFSVSCLRDEVYIAVIRNGIMCIEKMSDDKVDCCRPYEPMQRNVLFNNKDVYVYTDEVNYGKFHVDDYYVRAGSHTGAVVGLPYDYKITGNPIAINHKTTSIKKRITTADIVCQETPVLTFCGQKKTGQDNYKFFACTNYGNDVRYTIEGEFYKMHILSIQLNINYEG